MSLLRNKRLWQGLGGAVVLALLVMQLIPIEKSNPPVVQEPNWDSPQTRQLAQKACFDCHSNESIYPWYADVAPMRVPVRRHVLEGREQLNFSDYRPGDIDIDEVRELITEGEMPLPEYLWLHPEASLTELEKQALIEGLTQTAQQDE